MTALRSLVNFYNGVVHHNPDLGYLIRDDVMLVAMAAMSNDSTPGEPAVKRLREMSKDEPAGLRKVLENALLELGYS